MTGGATLVTGTLVTIDTLDTVLDTSRYVSSETIKDDVNKNNQRTKSAPNRINYERWQVVTAQIPSDVKRLINPGSNYELLLDDLVAQGWKLPVLADRVGCIKWYNAGKCGAILEHVLGELAGKAAPAKPGTPWCGRDGCNPITRTWAEASTLDDGSITHNCLQCHPKEIRVNNTNENDRDFMEFLKENFKDFGKF